jgi:hypothetical protein
MIEDIKSNGIHITSGQHLIKPTQQTFITSLKPDVEHKLEFSIERKLKPQLEPKLEPTINLNLNL